MTTRDRVLQCAVAELGSPGKSRIQQYHRSAIGPQWGGTKELEWCGLFCLWALHEADLARSVFWRLGGGFCEEQRLPRVKAPEPGDIAYFHSPFQHHALVESARNGIIVTIDGNQAGDTVQRKTRSSTSASVFYSIAPLLLQASDTEPMLPVVDPTLRLEASGPSVVILQELLNKAGAALVADGAFGPQTAAAVMSFQRRAGLDADGICGPLTWGALHDTR